MEGAEGAEGAALLLGGPQAVAARAPGRAFAFCNLIEEDGIARNKVRPSYPCLGPGGTRDSSADRAFPLGQATLTPWV